MCHLIKWEIYFVCKRNDSPSSIIRWTSILVQRSLKSIHLRIHRNFFHVFSGMLSFWDGCWSHTRMPHPFSRHSVGYSIELLTLRDGWILFAWTRFCSRAESDALKLISRLFQHTPLLSTSTSFCNSCFVYFLVLFSYHYKVQLFRKGDTATAGVYKQRGYCTCLSTHAIPRALSIMTLLRTAPFTYCSAVLFTSSSPIAVWYRSPLVFNVRHVLSSSLCTSINAVASSGFVECCTLFRFYLFSYSDKSVPKLLYPQLRFFLPATLT